LFVGYPADFPRRPARQPAGDVGLLECPLAGQLKLGFVESHLRPLGLSAALCPRHRLERRDLGSLAAFAGLVFLDALLHEVPGVSLEAAAPPLDPAGLESPRDEPLHSLGLPDILEILREDLLELFPLTNPLFDLRAGRLNHLKGAHSLLEAVLLTLAL